MIYLIVNHILLNRNSYFRKRNVWNIKMEAQSCRRKQDMKIRGGVTQMIRWMKVQTIFPIYITFTGYRSLLVTPVSSGAAIYINTDRNHICGDETKPPVLTLAPLYTPYLPLFPIFSTRHSFQLCTCKLFVLIRFNNYWFSKSRTD